MRLKKVIGIISVWLCVIGFFIIAGTAGASDLNTIDFMTSVENSLIGLLILTGGIFLGRIGGDINV